MIHYDTRIDIGMGWVKARVYPQRLTPDGNTYAVSEAVHDTTWGLVNTFGCVWDTRRKVWLAIEGGVNPIR